MSDDDRGVYPFVRPHPAAILAFGMFALLFVFDCVRAFVAWNTGAASATQVLIWLAWTSAIVGAFLLRYGLPHLVLAAYAQITPSMLAARYRWMDWEYPWQDVAALTLEEPNDLERFISWSPFARADIKYVKVQLRRPARVRILVLWKDKAGTRIVGVPIPWPRSIRIALREPERFVKDAQRFIASSPATPT